MSFDTMDYGENFQHLMLKVLVSEPDIFVRCQNILKPEYFQNKHAVATKYMLDYAQEYSTLPTTSEIELKSGIGLEKITDITPDNHQGFLETIEGFCRHRAIEQAIIQGSKLAQEKRYGKLEDLVKEAMLVSLQKDLGTDYYADPKARNEKLFDAQGTIRTGWNDVDFKLFGGFGTGELEIFVAPSGGGKSVALQNISKNYSQINKMNGVYITLELKEELVAQRIDAMLTGKGKKDLLGDLDGTAMEVQMKGKDAGKLFIRRMPESSTTVHDIRAYLRELQIKTGIKVDYIAVDYLDLLASPRVDPSDTFMKDKFVCEELRALAHELDINVVTASQLNRSAVEAEEYSHANIAGGISKIYTADNVIGIRNTPAMRERGEIMFEFLKTRNSNGVGSHVKLSYDVDTLNLGDHPEGGTAQYGQQNTSGNLAVAAASNTTQAQQALQQHSAPPAQQAAPAGSVQQNVDLASRMRNMLNGAR